MSHTPEKWRRLVSDFADRKVESIGDKLGELTPQEKKSVRSYYVRMGQDFTGMDRAEFDAKYAPDSSRWIPEPVRRFYNYDSNRI